MPDTIAAPVDLLESMAHLRLPPWEDARLQQLMDANTDGKLTDDEIKQLADLVEWSESLSLIRARAIHTLAARPT